MRRAGPLLLAVLMVLFGFAVYMTLGTQKSAPGAAARRPLARPPSALVLPGTIYLTQQGALYKLQGGALSQLAAAGGWMQPAVSPDGSRLLVVKRDFNVSDIYLMDADGHVVGQVTHDGSRITEVNRWAFYPRFGPGGAVFYSQDQPKVYDYRVDLAVWEIPGARAQSQARRWTSPNRYTGGDVSPLPLAGGGLIYVKYDVDEAGQSFSQVWLTAMPGSEGEALTPPTESCGQPALSPDGTSLALVCRSPGGLPTLEVAPFDGKALGPKQALAAPQALASPAWAPDGGGLAYFAPEGGGSGNFQLWWVALPKAGATPSSAGVAPAPKQVTSGLDLDTTAAPAWKP